ncbi:MAG: PDZ domain-containing protein [Deltaproteobacteria bacterium]|nr:PDZ domain-containing protein [Deltaproteobacteria bacterium]
MLTRYRPFVILLAITLLSYFSVDMFYRIIKAGMVRALPGTIVTEIKPDRKTQRRPTLDSYLVISDRNLFGSARKEKFAAAEQINVEELKETALNLALLGTVYSGDEGGFAVIEEVDKKKQGLYRIGDTVGEATIKKIMRGVVVLRVKNNDEVLMMEERKKTASIAGEVPEPAEMSSPSSVTVSKAEIENAFQDMNAVMTQVRIRPFFTDGKPDGFMISRIQKGSIFDRMGIQNGDVVQGVNSQALSSADDLLTLYQELKSGSEVLLNIKRRGQEETLKYVFEE